MPLLKISGLLCFVLLSLSAPAQETDEVSSTVSDIAMPVVRAPGAPQYSDVSFSPRWRRPRTPDDPYETFRDARSFFATRLDWVYSVDPEWIAECRKRGYWFTGTLNSILHDEPGSGTRERGRILDAEGNRIAAPWMVSWGGYWGCVNSPDYRATYLAHAKLLIDGGVDAIQMDDPTINSEAVLWGGCYCEHCAAAAEAQGFRLPEDMQAFQTISVARFFVEMRREIDAYAGRRVPWSSNNYNGRVRFPYDQFDYGIAELPHHNAAPANIFKEINDKHALDRQQIFTFVSKDIAESRRVIATAYASGGHIIVPYDVYYYNGPRIFGTPEEYADLYGFVRASATLLDGYENAAAIGPGIPEERYGDSLPISVDADRVYAFARAQPGEPDAPVVIHLVDWRATPGSFALHLEATRFFPDREVTATLHQPAAYDVELHETAAASRDFQSLAEQTPLTVETHEGQLRLTVPIALNPWGILVLEAK